MGEINVDVTSLGDKGKNIKKINAEIKNLFDEINKEIKLTSTHWKSSASDALVENYKSLDGKIDAFSSDLDRYAEYLIQTAEAYGYVEQKVNKNADAFID